MGGPPFATSTSPAYRLSLPPLLELQEVGGRGRGRRVSGGKKGWMKGKGEEEEAEEWVQ